MRGSGLAAVALGAAALLPACSPADIVGLTVTGEGIPVVDDCGTFVTGVEAVDAAGGRTVWAAHLPAGALEEHGGEAPVELGRLANEDWVEDSPLALAPDPGTWVFTIETETGSRERIRVADEALEPGMIYRPGHGLVSADEFTDRVCGLGFDPAGVAAFTAVGAGCILVAAVVGTRLSRRRVVQAFTPGAVSPGAPPPRDRG